MADQPTQILQTSKDPGELVVAAIRVARGASVSDHEVLRRLLSDPGFLMRLDSQEAYSGPRNHLRLASVLDTLAQNREAEARETLLSLTRSRSYLDFPSRVELLIESSAGLRPPPDELLSFWDRYFDPNDVYVDLIVRAIVTNGTQPALEMLEARFTDPAYQDHIKIHWMRYHILTHRNQANLLAMCSRLIQGKLSDPLRAHLVAALFDFDPEWFTPEADITRPRLDQFTPRARVEMLSLGEYILDKTDLASAQKKPVKDTMDQLRRAQQP